MIPALHAFYGLQPTPPADAFQFFVWEILSDHAALPARRDLAWQALRRLPALTPDAMFRAPAKDLLEAVGIAGPHRDEKVEAIRALVGEFKRHRDTLQQAGLAQLPLVSAARALRRVPMPAASRARALLFVANHMLLPLDGDAMRVIGRLRGTPSDRRRAPARRWLEERIARTLPSYREAVIYVRHHAQHTCLKVAPHCTVCPLRDGCPSASSTRLIE